MYAGKIVGFWKKYDGAMMAIEWAKAVGGTMTWGAKALRLVRGQRLIWQARDKILLPHLESFHREIIHVTRRLAAAIAAGNQAHAATQLASLLCDHFHDEMADLLELKSNQLHCCIKLIAPKLDPSDSTERDRIGTWVRSQPHDGRPIEQDPEKDFHAIEKNTVWCSFYGIPDGATMWKESFKCFCCNDLLKHGQLFRCDRTNWSDYYRSALVFPINQAKNAEGTEFARLGFLAFDSPGRGIFRGLPDIFDHRESPTEYRDSLFASSAFHLGAIFADLLGTSIGFASGTDSSSFARRSILHAGPSEPVGLLPAPDASRQE